MSAPNPIYVSPSTTFVQVDPLQSPYNPVLLNAVVYPGQTVTIRDATSSFGVLTSPIVISTILNTRFADGSISTLINQPQGFITAQTYSTNAWAFLNSFPFRNQFVSAGVLNLTTSTLYTALTSSIEDYTGSLTVENLIVTGNFVQSQGITLNTNVSSLGTVEFVSSLSVFDRTYLSSDMLVQGAMNIYSSLQVKGDFLVISSLTTVSSLSISSVVSVIGSLSTPAIQLGDGLVGTRLEVQVSSSQIDVGGSLLITSNLSTLGSMNVGGFVQLNSGIGAGNALFQSSASLYQKVSVSSLTSTMMEVTALGPLGVGGLLTVGSELFVQGSLFVNGNGFIKDLFTIGSTLITSSLFATTLETFGDYANNSTIAQISTVYVAGDYGGAFVSSGSTVQLGTYFSTGSNLTIRGNLFVSESGASLTNLSTQSATNVRSDLLVEGAFSNQQTLLASKYISTTGNLKANQSTIVGFSTFIKGDVFGLGNLVCDGTLTISSISLPSSLLANNFTAGKVFIGSKALVNNSILPTIRASSITVGYIPNTNYSFDLSGSIELPYNPLLSTGILSTQIYNACLFPINTQYTTVNSNTTFVVPNGMGVGVEAKPSTFLVNPLAYFLSSPVFSFSTFSTGYVIAENLQGTFVGDGSQISNVQYPEAISTYEIFVTGNTGSAIYSKLFVSSMNVSNLDNQGTLLTRSTLTIGSFKIQGNAKRIEYNVGSNTLYTSSAANLMVVNDVKFFGNATGSAQRRVAINEDFADKPFTASLGVWSTLAVNGLPPDFPLDPDTLTARKIIVSSLVDGFNGFSSYPEFAMVEVLSGNLSTPSGKFFLGESEIYDNRFNIVQPYLSTLQFNSTLFVNREGHTIGINTAPKFNLDVESLGVNTTTITNTSTFSAGIQFLPFQSTLTYAFINSNTTPENVLFSQNDTSWTTMESLFKQVAITETYTYNSYYSLGRTVPLSVPSGDKYAKIQQAGSLVQYFLGTFVSGGVDFGLISLMKSVGNRYQWFDRIASGSGLSGFPSPSAFNSMASDGTNFVAGGTWSYTNQAIFNAIPIKYTMYTSSDGLNFTGISYDSTGSCNIFPPFYPGTPQIASGCYSLIYGGFRAPVWIAAGAGKSEYSFGGMAASLYRSIDAVSWQRAYINSNNDNFAPTGQYLLKSALAVPYEKETLFLAGGTTYLLFGGFTQTLFVSYNMGIEWEYVASAYSGTINQMATNGSIIVAAVDNPVSLLYSPVNRFRFNGWSQAQGATFTTRANSVLWNGSIFVASGDSGIRHSIDGVTWYNPGGYSSEILNLGYTSNVGTNMYVGNVISVSTNFLLLQNSPSIPCQNIISAATISYYPNTTMNLNNALVFDSNQNVIVPGTYNTISPLGYSPYTSSFVSHSSYISTFMSTNKFVVGAYVLGVQSV